MKATIISIITAVTIIIVVTILTRSSGVNENIATVDNVTVVDGKQIIEIRAKGGYQPQKTIAKAGLPTVLRFDTSGTFDCSASVRIPSLDISKNLPASGVTEIDLGNQKQGTLQGMCGMGMYPFEVEFQD